MSQSDVDEMFCYIKSIIDRDCPVCFSGIGVLTADYIVQYNCGYSAMPLYDEAALQWVLHPLNDVCSGASNVSKSK